MTTSASSSHLGALAAAWAVLGWSGVLVVAIARLGALALEALRMDLDGVQTLALGANALVLAWAEGYRGFQVRFSPRAAARVLYLREHATPVMAALAPFFCVGFFGASARVLRLTWFGAGLIVLVIIVVHRLPQPWRGIIDAGVVIGLGWGLGSFLSMVWRALATRRYPVLPEVPAAATPGKGPGL